MVDATHGIVWVRVNKESAPRSMRWVWTEDTHGKEKWFVYDATADGVWPTPPAEDDESQAQGGDDEDATLVSWGEWWKRADAIRKGDDTTIKKLRALRDEAEKITIRETVKIVDIEPNGTGARVVVCKVWGGTWRGWLEVAEDQLDEIENWGKWDRLTWRARVVVNGLEDHSIHGEVLYDGPSSVVRKPNPGVGAEYEPTVADPSSYFEWHERYASSDGDARTQLLEAVHRKTFVDEGKVVAKEGRSLTVRFPGVGDDVRFTTGDPQVEAEVNTGDTVLVATRVERRDRTGLSDDTDVIREVLKLVKSDE
jgi:hypothetical protein